MGFEWTRSSCLVVAVALSSCAGVPRLYRSADANPTKTIAPKVHDIVDEITCELINVSNDHFKEKSYLISATLTLQVNDEINVTPSLSFITPLAIASTSRTYNQNLGIGGARERSFSSVFHFDSLELKHRKKCTEDPKRLYRLDGNLGLAEIARDGVGIRDKQLLEDKLSPPTETSFASQVKFIVTRSVSALGPTWTLVSFKGPGGANGLLNGKALKTDTLIISFAAKKTGKTAADLQLEATNRLIELLTRQAERAKAEADVARTKALGAQNNFFSTAKNGSRSPGALQLLQIQVDRADAQETEARRRSEQAQAELDRGRLDLQAAKALAEVRNTEEALATNRSLTSTLILQNLNVQPR